MNATQPTEARRRFRITAGLDRGEGVAPFSVTWGNEVRISARVHRKDDPLAFLTAIASESSPCSRIYTASEHASKQHLVTFASSLASQTATSTTPVLIFGSEDVRVKEVEEALKPRLGVKSGGKGPQRSECGGLPKRGDG